MRRLGRSSYAGMAALVAMFFGYLLLAYLALWWRHFLCLRPQPSLAVARAGIREDVVRSNSINHSTQIRIDLLTSDHQKPALSPQQLPPQVFDCNPQVPDHSSLLFGLLISTDHHQASSFRITFLNKQCDKQVEIAYKFPFLPECLPLVRRLPSLTWTLSNFCRGKPQAPFDQDMQNILKEVGEDKEGT